ncbi:hypothetical protein KAR91_87280 [Candidatus Pacearchaeota archaeon]|nr:hypothetical protein [Candidatus Pacearchaeota archaeon]
MANDTFLRVFAEQVYNGLPEYLQGEDSQATINALVDIYSPFFDLIATLFHNERRAVECTQESLDLLAQEGSLVKLDTEPLDSFRVRVDEKFFNQIRSGTFSGFGRILQLFGIPEGKEAIELVSGSLWDFVFIAEDKIDQSIVPPEVLRELAGTKYGRTGRIFNGILDVPVFQYDLDSSPDASAGGYGLGKYLNFSFGD